MSKNIRVGVGLYIFNENNELLIGLRKSKHGNDTWSPPGGHVDFGEGFKVAAARETKEETNLDINIEDIKEVATTNDIYLDEDKHYVTIHLITRKYSGKLILMEPEKCSNWKWVSLDNLPDNMFLSAKNFLNSKDIIYKHLK